MPSKKKREDLPLFLSPDQAAKISGLGVNRIRQLMEDGQLEYLPCLLYTSPSPRDS